MPPIPPTVDPALPATNSAIVSQELRDQFNSLNDRIVSLEQANTDLQGTVTDLQTQIGLRITEDQLDNIMSDYVTNNSSANTNAIATDDDTLSDPPIFDDIDNLRNKVNELINSLKR